MRRLYIPCIALSFFLLKTLGDSMEYLSSRSFNVMYRYIYTLGAGVFGFMLGIHIFVQAFRRKGILVIKWENIITALMLGGAAIASIMRGYIPFPAYFPTQVISWMPQWINTIFLICGYLVASAFDRKPGIIENDLPSNKTEK